jgi:hypothetical protein
MRLDSRLSAALALLSLAACGDGSKTADVVQAATRGAAELGQQLAETTAQLAQMAPEEARTKLRELLDATGRTLREIRDSETAQKVLAELERLLDQLVALARKLGEKIDLASLQQSASEMAERFQNDPRVQTALKGLRDKLDELTH